MTPTERAGLNNRTSVTMPTPQVKPVPAGNSKEVAMASIIRGIHLLASHARHHGLGNASRILACAREDLVYWAADMNFHEGSKDHFPSHPLHEMPTDISSALLHCLNGLNDGPQRRALVAEFAALMKRANALATHQQVGDSD